MRLPVTSQLLFYTAAVALVGLIATEARGTPAAWTGSMARDVAAATAESTDAPLILVRRGGGGGGRGGGGFRGGGGGGFRTGGGGGFRGGGGSWAGAGRGNFNRANA